MLKIQILNFKMYQIFFKYFYFTLVLFSTKGDLKSTIDFNISVYFTQYCI